MARLLVENFFKDLGIGHLMVAIELCNWLRAVSVDCRFDAF